LGSFEDAVNSIAPVRPIESFFEARIKGKGRFEQVVALVGKQDDRGRNNSIPVARVRVRHQLSILKELDAVIAATLRLIFGNSRRDFRSRQKALRMGACTQPQLRLFLVGLLSLLEHLVGVGSGGPPLKKPRFYASSAMLTLWEVKSQSILMS
jgi:hypothetical protein